MKTKAASIRASVQSLTPDVNDPDCYPLDRTLVARNVPSHANYASFFQKIFNETLQVDTHIEATKILSHKEDTRIMFMIRLTNAADTQAVLKRKSKLRSATNKFIQRMYIRAWKPLVEHQADRNFRMLLKALGLQDQLRVLDNDNTVPKQGPDATADLVPPPPANPKGLPLRHRYVTHETCQREVKNRSLCPIKTWTNWMLFVAVCPKKTDAFYLLFRT